MNDDVSPQLNWLERLFEEQATKLVLYGRALGLSHSESEDILQEVFVALIKRDSPPEQPTFYCLRAVRNRALNHRRTLWRRIQREMEASRWFETNPDETEQEREAIRCLAKLPVEQREVIVLKIWHGYTYEEIGRLLEISPHTVAGRYRYGLEKMRTVLKGWNYERMEFRGESAQTVDSTINITTT
jgi:RNA polymerase sigma-70 factor (ECF subfamily)